MSTGKKLSKNHKKIAVPPKQYICVFLHRDPEHTIRQPKAAGLSCGYLRCLRNSDGVCPN